MKIIKKILVAIDLSESALNAVEYAIALAKETNAELEIVHIVKYAMGNIDAGILPSDIEKLEKERAKVFIDTIKEEHEDIKIEDFETVGRPAEEIKKEINKWEADLLVIGHHTHSFLERIILSSVEKNLLKHLKCPVLIIPGNYRK